MCEGLFIYKSVTSFTNSYHANHRSICFLNRYNEGPMWDVPAHICGQICMHKPVTRNIFCPTCLRFGRIVNAHQTSKRLNDESPIWSGPKSKLALFIALSSPKVWTVQSKEGTEDDQCVVRIQIWRNGDHFHIESEPHIDFFCAYVRVFFPPLGNIVRTICVIQVLPR